MSFWNDIRTAVRLTGEIRKARENGSTVEVRRVWRVPALKPTYWGYTMEFCLMRDREMEKAILAVFNTFPEPIQHSLTFTPKGRGPGSNAPGFGSGSLNQLCRRRCITPLW